MYDFIIKSKEAEKPLIFKLNGTTLQARKAAFDLSKKIGTVSLTVNNKCIATYCCGNIIE